MLGNFPPMAVISSTLRHRGVLGETSTTRSLRQFTDGTTMIVFRSCIYRYRPETLQLRWRLMNLDDPVWHVNSGNGIQQTQYVQLPGVAPVEKKVQGLRGVLKTLDNVETALDAAFLQPLGDLLPSIGETIHIIEAGQKLRDVSERNSHTTEEVLTQGNLQSLHVVRSGSCKM